MGRSPWLRVYPQELHALVTGLAFALAPLVTSLASLSRSNSPDHNAKGTQSDALSGEPPSHPPTACKRTVSGSLSLPALGCFSPVPHGTRPLSVIQESLALEGGPPSFTPGSSSRALLRNSTSISPSSSPTGLSPSLARLSRRLRLTSLTPSVGPTTPTPQGGRFGLYRFRSPLLSASRLISLPHGTEMFQFPWFASVLRQMIGYDPDRVSPFGHPRITGCVRLPLAFRSLPRPSSPLYTQASPVRFRSLDYRNLSSNKARALI